jgi:hypothetical protein
MECIAQSGLGEEYQGRGALHGKLGVTKGRTRGGAHASAGGIKPASHMVSCLRPAWLGRGQQIPGSLVARVHEGDSWTWGGERDQPKAKAKSYACKAYEESARRAGYAWRGLMLMKPGDQCHCRYW